MKRSQDRKQGVVNTYNIFITLLLEKVYMILPGFEPTVGGRGGNSNGTGCSNETSWLGSAGIAFADKVNRGVLYALSVGGLNTCRKK